MTVRNGVMICELNQDCAGFTYQGPVWDLDEKYEMYFFR
jgi:hypothetical protein